MIELARTAFGAARALKFDQTTFWALKQAGPAFGVRGVPPNPEIPHHQNSSLTAHANQNLRWSLIFRNFCSLIISSESQVPGPSSMWAGKEFEMKHLLRTLTFSSALWGTLLILTPVLHSQSFSTTRHWGYEGGFRDGFDYGHDAQLHGVPLNERQTTEYRYAGHGYRESLGPREEYQVGYREGFRLGAEDGFAGVSVRRDELLRDTPETREEIQSLAADTGYHDGAASGLTDLRNHQAFHPAEHDSWKNADHGYRPALGTRDAYRRAYRTAFEAGYQDVYNGRY